MKGEKNQGTEKIIHKRLFEERRGSTGDTKIFQNIKQRENQKSPVWGSFVTFLVANQKVS